MLEQMPKKIIKINLNAVKSIGDIGIRRAYVFLGLGVNAARTPELDTYELPGSFQIIFAPPTKNQKDIETEKKEFERWIVGNALRELFESSSLYLNSVYDVLLLIDVSNENISPSERIKKFKSFEHSGMQEKLSRLKKEYKAKSTLSAQMKSINRARNILTHNRGVVRHKDTNNKDHDKLTIKWRTLTLEFKHTNGEVEKITEAKFPFHAKAGGVIRIIVRNRQRSFRIGSLINLQPNELHELCLTFYIANSEIYNSLISKMKALGLLTQDDQ